MSKTNTSTLKKRAKFFWCIYS